MQKCGKVSERARDLHRMQVLSQKIALHSCKHASSLLLFHFHYELSVVERSRATRLRHLNVYEKLYTFMFIASSVAFISTHRQLLHIHCVSVCVCWFEIETLVSNAPNNSRAHYYAAYRSTRMHLRGARVRALAIWLAPTHPRSRSFPLHLSHKCFLFFCPFFIFFLMGRWAHAQKKIFFTRFSSLRTRERAHVNRWTPHIYNGKVEEKCQSLGEMKEKQFQPNLTFVKPSNKKVYRWCS